MTRHFKVFSFGLAMLALLAVGSISGRGVFAQDSGATPNATTDDSTITDDNTEKGPSKRESRSGRGGGMHMGGFHKLGGFHVDAEALATFLGMTTDELRTEMRAGSSLAEVAEAQGITRDELKTFLMDQYTAELDALIDASVSDKNADDNSIDSIATPEIDATPAASTGILA